MSKPTLLASAILLVVATMARADWPQFMGPSRNNVSDEKGLIRALPAAVKEVWSAPLHDGYSGAAVLGKEVFILDRDDSKDILHCIDLGSGKDLWTCSYDAPGKVNHPGNRSTPAVDEKYVFTVGPMGHFTCVDRATHKSVWSKDLIDDFGAKMPMWNVAQSPLLYKDLVIVAPLGQTAGVVAFEKATGKAKWSSKPAGPMSYCSAFATTIEGVEQIIAVSSSATTGIDAATGDILWNYNGWTCRNSIPNPTLIGDGRIFLTAGYDAGSAMIKVSRPRDNVQVGKFEVSELYKVAAHGSQLHAAMLIDNCLYFSGKTNSVRDGLICMDLDGKVLWQTGNSPVFDRGTALLADGLLWCLDDGTLRLVEPSREKYKELGSAKLFTGEKEPWGPMAISDGKLLVRGKTQLKCIDVGK